MVYTKCLEISLVNADTGEVLGKSKRAVRLSDVPLTPLEGNKLIGNWIGSMLRGFKQVPNLALQFVLTDFSAPRQLTFDNPI